MLTLGLVVGCSDPAGGTDGADSESDGEPTNSSSSGPQATSGTEDPPWDGVIALEIAEPLELCANSHSSVFAPEAFFNNARLSIDAQRHEVGLPVVWESDADGTLVEPPPVGTPVDFTAQIRFAFVDPQAPQRFTGGAFAAVLDRRTGGREEPGAVYLFPAVALFGEAGPLSAASLRLAVAGFPDAAGSVRVLPPQSRREADFFRIAAACRNNDVDVCSIGPSRRPVGAAVDFTPCQFPIESRRTWQVETERGAFEFDLYNFERDRSDGLGLFGEARGTFDGIAFQQSDVMKLVMGRGGFSSSGLGESFGVLFDAPIGDVCGFMVEHLGWDPRFEHDPLGRIGYEVGCDLSQGTPFLVDATDAQ